MEKQITVHDLKIDPDHFERIFKRQKRFEIRKDDRKFEDGDILILNEYDRTQKTFSGRKILVLTGKIYREEVKFALKEKYCVIEIIFREEFSEEQNNLVNEYFQSLFGISEGK